MYTIYIKRETHIVISARIGCLDVLLKVSLDGRIVDILVTCRSREGSGSGESKE
jgi:hypothetical protein